MKPAISLLAALALAVCVRAQSPATAKPSTQQLQQLQQLPLLQKESLVYEGAFGFQTDEINGTRFGYGGMALAFDRVSGTMLMVGHDHHQKVAEFAIPEIRPADGPLADATVVQPFHDPTDGKFNTIGERSYAKVGGLLPYGGRLIVSMFNYYDAAASQQRSHFVSDRDLSKADDAKGPFKVGRTMAGYVSGYMTLVPEAWRAALGGPALTGNCCLNIISRTSYGPALFSFNPDDVGVKDTAPATPLVYYPPDDPLAEWDATSPLFNGTTVITGVVFPEGTRSVLFFGRHGVGKFCYGSTCFPGAGQGTHASPYVSMVWAYDAADLAAVKAGSKKPWNLRPYATWEVIFPVSPSLKFIRGAAYDPATNRIFVTQARDEHPLVHVYKVRLP